MNSRSQFQAEQEQIGYIAEPGLAATLQIFTQLRRPLLVEGEAGVGKTEIAKALANLFNTSLIRLQCYEGLDASNAVYEWNYQRQLLAIKMQEHEHISLKEKEQHIFSESFLLARPLLKAITQPSPPVLLVDEVDRADEEFEAYLLEIFSDFQVNIPELGTIKATSIPYVVLTSNGTRELSDALRRRCLYHYVDYPSMDKEWRIVQRHEPQISQRLASQVTAFVHGLRAKDLRKKPGVAETLDWVAALLSLNIDSLDIDTDRLAETLICLLKTKEDRDAVNSEELKHLIAQSL